MSLISVQRDGTYVHPERTDHGWGAAFAVGANPDFVGEGTMNVDFGEIHTNGATPILAAGQCCAAGIYMQPPNGDRTPYRVKGGILGSQGLLIVGIAPAVITGAGDTITDPVSIAFFGDLDQTIIIEQSAGLPDRAIAFLIAFYSAAGSAATTITAAMSVQNMGVKPPTMQNAVS